MITKKERASAVRQILQKLFPSPTIPLEHRDPYTLLIAVLLSAQCTDVRVNLVTPKLFAKARTPQEMIKLSVQEIQEIIRTCGLSNAKARAIWQLSHDLIDRHGGKVPKTFQGLEALPGVGHKTASVVMAQAFGKPAFPVDSHIHRCAERWDLSRGKNVVQTERDLKRLFPRNSWRKVHLQIIYYARKYCPARGHKVEACPICKRLTFS
ncbi:MAG: endonuclease III [Chlamydiales bacterium]